MTPSQLFKNKISANFEVPRVELISSFKNSLQISLSQDRSGWLSSRETASIIAVTGSIPSADKVNQFTMVGLGAPRTYENTNCYNYFHLIFSYAILSLLVAG